MRAVYIFALVFLPFSLAEAETDEIDAWLKGFNQLSLNGAWPTISLPDDASSAEIVATYAKTTIKTVDAPQYDGYRIIETRKVPPDLELGGNGGTIVDFIGARQQDHPSFAARAWLDGSTLLPNNCVLKRQEEACGAKVDNI